MKRFIGPGFTVLCAGALLALFAFGLTEQGGNRSLDAALSAGRRPPAPDRSLPMLGADGTRSLAYWRGHVVVLNFWASWCPPCQDEARLLEQTQRSVLTPAGGTIVGVTWRDASPDSLSFVHQHDITYPNLRDVDGALAQAYGTAQLPETFVIDAHGDVVAISRGEVDRSFLDQAIALAERS